MSKSVNMKFEKTENDNPQSQTETISWHAQITSSILDS